MEPTGFGCEKDRCYYCLFPFLRMVDLLTLCKALHNSKWTRMQEIKELLEVQYGIFPPFAKPFHVSCCELVFLMSVSNSFRR